MVKEKNKLKICKLNKTQDKFWINSFSFHLDNGKSHSQSDKLAFKD